MLLPVHPSLQALCQRDFDAATINRGTRYQRQGRVKKLSVRPAEKGAGGLVLTARVRGSDASPYAVTVTVGRDGTDGEPTALSPMCSCPVGYACKHAFAVLAQAAVDMPDLFDGEPEPAATAKKSSRSARPAAAANPALPVAWKRWAEELRRTVAPAGGGGAEEDPRRLHFVLHPVTAATAEKTVRAAGGGKKKLSPGGETVVPALTVATVVADRWDEDGACLGKPTPMPLPVALGTAAARGGPASSGPFSPTPTDRQLLRALLAAQPGFGSGGLALNYFAGGVGSLNVLMQLEETSRLEGFAGADLLKALLSTGRCHWENASTTPLRLGAACVGRPAWVLDAEGGQRPGFDLLTAEGEAIPPAPRRRFLTLGGPWVLDPDAGVCGPVETGWSDALATAWHPRRRRSSVHPCRGCKGHRTLVLGR